MEVFPHEDESSTAAKQLVNQPSAIIRRVQQVQNRKYHQYDNELKIQDHRGFFPGLQVYKGDESQREVARRREGTGAEIGIRRRSPVSSSF